MTDFMGEAGVISLKHSKLKIDGGLCQTHFISTDEESKMRCRMIGLSPLVLAMSMAWSMNGVAQTNISTTQSTSAEISSGTINGVVVNSVRGNYLNGAIIRLVGTTRTTRSDRAGQFSFSGLESGRYEVEIDFLGYETQTIEVDLGASQGSRVEIAMLASGIVEDRILVRALRDQQTRELNQQRAADNIINVISSDSIGRFPDGNVAEALGRVAGVAVQRDQGEGRYISIRGTPIEFNGVSLNGVTLTAPDGGTSAVDLDTIPTDAVSSIEITKALLPSMDADSIGGNINIVTRGALESDGPIRRVSAGLGRNEQGGGKNERYNLAIGDQFNNRTIGALFSASYTSTERETDNYENDFGSNDGQIFPEAVEFKDYEVTRERYALDGRLDFLVSDNMNLFVTGLHAVFKDDEFRHALELKYDDYAAGSNPTVGTATDVEFTRELRHRRVENTINSFSFGGEMFLDNMTVDFTAAYTEAEQVYPIRNYLIYEFSDALDVDYDFSSPNNPVWTVAGGQPNQLGLNPAGYEFAEYQNRASVSTDEDFSLAANISMPMTFGRGFGELKFGMKYVTKEKTRDQDRKVTKINAANLSLSDVTRGDVSQNFNIILGERFFLNFFDQYGSTYQSQPDFVSVPRRNFTSDYSAEQDIIAGYGMATVDWDETRMVAGLRVERTEFTGNAFRFNRQTNGVTPTSDGKTETHFFPNLQFRREIGADGILRVAYTTAVNRPKISDRVPAIEERDRGPGRRTVKLGNPDLKSAYAHNFDVMFDYYIRPVGVFSVGAFYKRIDDVIFEISGDGPFEGNIWDITRPENGGQGSVLGLELNWQQSFSNMGVPFDGLGMFATLTLVESEADLPFGLGEVRLPGQSDQVYNLGLFYEKAGFNARLAYNWRSKYIDDVSLETRDLDTYWDERGQVDFTTSYQVNETFQLYGEASNLTNTKQNRFSGSPDRVYEREGFGRVWQVGVRANF